MFSSLVELGLLGGYFLIQERMTYVGRLTRSSRSYQGKILHLGKIRESELALGARVSPG